MKHTSQLTPILLLVVSFALFPGCEKQGWRSYSPKTGTFTAEFPAKPESRTDFNKQSGPNSLMLYHYGTEKDGISYVVTQAKAYGFTGGFTDEAVYQQSREAVEKMAGGPVVREQPVEITLLSGMEFYVQGKDRSTVLRVFRDENYIWQLTVQFPPSVEDSPDIERFLNSFDVLKTKADEEKEEAP